MWERETPYELLRMKGAITAVLFKSGKLLLQGKDGAVEKARKMLISEGYAEQKKVMFVKETGIIIGSDECLKGDTFGGLVVAAVKADDSIREKLLLLGAQDSKKVKDKDIPELAAAIEQCSDHVVKSIYPEEYNHHAQTALLNNLHMECAELLLGKASQGMPQVKVTHVIDKYPGCAVGDIRTTHAEDKYVEVAAASILARNEGLKQLQMLSSSLGYPVPKGSTHVKDGLLFLKNSGKDPKQFVKMHFRNVQEVIGF